MLRPRLSALGRALPRSWSEAILARPRGLDLPSLLADCFVSYTPDAAGFDPARARRALFMVDQLVCRYFRMTVIGGHNLPPGRALIIGCHSGGLPWDAACLVVAIQRATRRFSRNAGDRIFGRFAAVERFLGARGAVIGDPSQLEALLAQDELVVLFPGGAKDMTRPIWERYRVKPHRGFAPGRGGYIRLALRTRSPIVPVAIVGAEETHLLLANLAPVARLLALPYVPLFLSPLPLPARIYVRFGAPIRLAATPEAAADQETVDRLNVEVRHGLQALIDDTRRRRRGIYWSSYDGEID
jgi:1-acyl-sn-glycerol-3-phosphate acyltransferase